MSPERAADQLEELRSDPQQGTPGHPSWPKAPRPGAEENPAAKRGLDLLSHQVIQRLNQ